MRRGKRVLGVLLLLAVLFVVGSDAISPILRTRELERIAEDAAGAAQDTYLRTGDQAQASIAAREVVVDARESMLGFEILNGGGTRVTVGATARSYLAGRIGPLRHHYEVKGTATAQPRAGEPPASSTTKAG